MSRYNDRAAPIPNYHLYGEKRLEAVRSFFHIDRLEKETYRGNGAHHPHRHKDLYQLTWIKAGKGLLEIDLIQTPIQSNALFFLAPQVTHACSHSVDLEGYVAHFSKDFLPLEFEGNQLKGNEGRALKYQVSYCEEADKAYVDFLFERMYTEQVYSGIGSDQSIHHLLQLVLLHQTRLKAAYRGVGAKNQAHLLFGQLVDLVNLNFTTERSIQFYAAQLHVSPSYLNQCVKAATGKSASDFIQQKMVKEAKLLLQFTTLSVSEIALQLGFEDVNYFWKYFKRNTQLSPGAFRKIHSA